MEEKIIPASVLLYAMRLILTVTGARRRRRDPAQVCCLSNHTETRGTLAEEKKKRRVFSGSRSAVGFGGHLISLPLTSRHRETRLVSCSSPVPLKENNPPFESNAAEPWL